VAQEVRAEHSIDVVAKICDIDLMFHARTTEVTTMLIADAMTRKGKATAPRKVRPRWRARHIVIASGEGAITTKADS
jgi:hypothetical protein